MPSAPTYGKAMIAPDAEALAARTAAWIAGRIAAKSGQFLWALSGGSTPRRLYERLGARPYAQAIAWPKVLFFWGDERFVPYSDPDSNFRMAKETLLAHIPIPPENIHPMPTDGDPDDAARRYEKLLKTIYGADTLDPARPLFDLQMLGLGDDGHTASLIPNQPVLRERTRWVTSVPQGRNEIRLTLTYPAIESSAAIAFLVSGEKKQDAVARARAGDPAFPAAHIRPQGELLWFLDAAAAGEQG